MPVSPRRRIVTLTSLAAFAATVAIPATAPIAMEALRAQPFAAELLPAATLATNAQALNAAALNTGTAVPAVFLADATTSDDRSGQDDAGTPLDEELVCLAKAVRHEAGNQGRAGQLAVAQVIVNRVHSGRFAATVCGVVNQQGQFFRTSDYHPDRKSAVWAASVDASRQALSGQSENVAPGALFFHAAFQAPKGFFRNRQRVAMLGGNVFYR